MGFFSKRSIFTKIFSTVAFTLFLVILFQVLYFPAQQIRQLEDALDRKVRSLATVLLHDITSALDFNDMKSATDSIGALREDPDFSFAVLFDKDRQVLATVGIDNASALKLDSAWVEDAIARPVGDALHLKAPLVTKAGNKALLLLALHRTSITEESVRIRWTTLLVGGIVLIVAMFLVWLVTSRINQTIQATTVNLARTTAGLLSTSTQQVGGVNEQSTAVVETVTAVQQVKQTSEHTRDRAKAVAESAHRSGEIGRIGQQAVEETVGVLSLAKEQVDSIVQNILALAERTKAIGEIIATVNDVAEQTHLLALNAAIEASRAGEHGKGFSVVATEVKALADTSKKATARVRQILSEIQDATTKTASAAQEGTRSMGNATRAAAKAGQTIKELSESISASAELAAQIEIASTQQVSGITQVQQAIKQIDSVVHQSAESASQIEKASRDLDQLGSELRLLVSG